MARRKTTPPADIGATIDVPAIEAASAARDQDAKRLAVIDQQFGSGLPYDRYRLVAEARFYLNESAEAMLEAGRRLVLIKEHELHGEWLDCLADIGLSLRSAQKMMQAAVKYSNTPGLAKLGRTKLLELMAEDDEDLQALAEGGTLAGHTLDDVDRMSTRDLRETLRKERAARTKEATAHERMLDRKNKKIDELDRKLHDKEHRTREWPFRVREIQIETTTLGGGVLENLDRLDVLRDAILNEDFGEEDKEAAIEAMAVVYYDACSQILMKASTLMAYCENVFQGYKDAARPMIEVDLPTPPTK